jgi:predicted dehydrogenase
MAERSEYALETKATGLIEAPVLDYRPPKPKGPAPKIALIGAGGISFAHLDAYRTAGWEVAAICSRTFASADKRRDEFYPDAAATTDFKALLQRDDIAIFDITPHPDERLPLIAAALKAGKHVLSQKPFVTDLADGERLVRLADVAGVKLAVNQNGRWAPHMAWMRAAVRGGLIGDVISCHTAIHWDHGWIKGTAFEDVRDIVLYDFGIHWFDFLCSIASTRANSVMAQRAVAKGQTVRPPLLASALVGFENMQASLIFDAAVAQGPLDETYIGGTKGTLVSRGPNLGEQTVELHTADGVGRPVLEGKWFNDGFAGAMGELMCAIEDDREPENGARGNLESLALCFAAIAAADKGREVRPGTVRRLPS